MKKIEIPSLARSPSGDQELQLAPGLPGLPERLLLAHAQGRVLIIAGAGVSMQPPSCLPDFGSLVRRVFAQLDGAIGAHLNAPTDGRGIGGIKGSLPLLDAEQTAMLGRLGEEEFDVALGMLERRMDRDQERESTVRRAVAGILRETRSHAPIHTSLVRLANRGGAATIATTNFDLLLERAAKALRTPLQRYALHDIPRPSLRPEFAGALHLHGALDQNPERHPDLVLTDRDFGEYYLRRRAIPDLIYDAARIFHVVLVGYSLGDPPMRYLLNAVAADGQRFSDLKERFAFVGMDWSSDQAASEKRQAELATWIGRGITPIPYDKADGHRALAKVLAAWAKLSPHTAGDNADKEVRRIFRLQRAAASEASAALFGHVFRRSSDEAQVRIAKAHRDGRADPAWLDGMLEIVRETGNIADREAHASRLCQVALDERLTEPTLLKWAAKLRGHQTAERRAVLELLQLRLDGKIPESWRTAWGIIAETQLAADTDRQGFQDYLLSNRIKEGDRSGALIAEVARLVAPRLSVEWRSEVPWLSGRTPKKFRDINDILHLSVVSSTVEIGRGLNLEAVSEVDFLIELAEALEAEVARGLHIGRRIGWHADRDLAWLGGLDRVRLRGNGKHDDPDRFHQGIAPAVRLLMRTIDTRLRIGKDSWSGPARTAWDWLEGINRASRLAQSLLSTSGSREHFGKAWNAVGQRFRPPSSEAAQGPDETEFLPLARQMLREIPLLSHSVLQEAVGGLSNWLENWAVQLRGDTELPIAIARLWTSAAAASSRTIDATDYKEEEGAEAKRIAHDSLNSPIGDLAGAFLRACPNLTEIPHPFEANADLRAVRDLVADTVGRAGVIARYRCTTALPYLMHADRAWSEAALVSRLENGPESDVLWHAVAHSPLRRNVMARLGQLMARRAVHGALELEIRQSLVERVCFAMLGDMWTGQTYDGLLPDAQQMLRSIPGELRAYAARAIERFMDDAAQSQDAAPSAREEIFDRAIAPFLVNVWPQERAAVTPAVAKAFASLPAASARRFTRAVSLLRRFLVPFEAWSIHDWGFQATDGEGIRENTIVGAEEATAALDLLDLTISKNADARVPRGLDRILALLALQNQALQRDPRLSRLTALMRS